MCQSSCDVFKERKHFFQGQIRLPGVLSITKVIPQFPAIVGFEAGLAFFTGTKNIIEERSGILFGTYQLRFTGCSSFTYTKLLQDEYMRGTRRELTELKLLEPYVPMDELVNCEETKNCALPLTGTKPGSHARYFVTS